MKPAQYVFSPHYNTLFFLALLSPFLSSCSSLAGGPAGADQLSYGDGHSSNAATSSSSTTPPNDPSCSNTPASRPSFQISPKAIVSDACASYSTLERLNSLVQPAVDDLTHNTDFFSHYRLNLFHKSCPFWNDENGMCGNIGCAVQTLDNEEDIPLVWRASELGKLEGPHAPHPGRAAQREKPKRPLQGELGEDVGESCVVEYDDECDEIDYCVPEDESALSKGDYVSLITNPERFTGYAGEGAKQVWDAIYRENCFQKTEPEDSSSSSGFSSHPGPAALDFKSVLDAAGRKDVLEQERQHNPNTPFVAQTGFELEDECLEKRVFYRVVSGMHASISTHLCWDFLNQTTGLWTPNLKCYDFRLHRHPDRIANLYFNFALVTRAVAKLGPEVEGGKYTFCTGDVAQDAETRSKVLQVTRAAAGAIREEELREGEGGGHGKGVVFDESVMFRDGLGVGLKEDFRNRFRNVSRLMDCVGCDKCRLWGKVQTQGYGTALKVLFETDGQEGEGGKAVGAPMLKRTELVALFNTYARLASSLRALTRFRGMLEEEEEAEKTRVAGKAEATGIVLPPVVKEEGVPTSSPVEAQAAEKGGKGGHGKTEEDMPRKKKGKTVEEQFYAEAERIYKAFKYVITSWAHVPRNLYRITVSEIVRAWQYYAGLPVNPRIWSWERPIMDEL